MKKVLKYIAFLLIGLFVALLLLPFLFEKELEELVKTEANKRLNGELAFSDLDLSFIRSFPDVSVQLKDFHFKHLNDTEGDQLIRSKSAGIDINLGSFIKKDVDYVINNIEFNEADIRVHQFNNGQTNYQVFKKSDGSSNSYEVDLRSYQIRNSNVDYVDARNNVYITAKQVDHSGSGNLSATNYELQHDTKVDSLDVLISNINYVSNGKLDARMITNIDQPNKTYTVTSKSARINDLELSTNGKFTLNENGVDMDLALNSQDANLSSLLSAIPYVFKKNYSDLSIAGLGSLSCSLNGLLNASNKAYPKLSLALTTQDGVIGTKQIDEKITDFNSLIKVSADAIDWSDLKINIPDFSMILNDELFTGSFSSTKELETTLYELSAKGKLDLNKLQNIIAFNGIESMQGIADLDIEFSGSDQDIKENNYTALDFKQLLKSDEITIQLQDQEAYTFKNIDIQGTPEQLNINELTGNLGDNQFSLEGKISDPLKALLPDELIKGEIQFESDRLDLSPNPDIDTQTTSTIPVDRYEIDFSGSITELIYNDHRFENTSLNGSAGVQSAYIENFKSEVNGSPIIGNAKFNNLFGYMFDMDTLYGELDLQSTSLNIDRFISGDSEGTAEYIKIPENISLLIESRLDQVTYGNYKASNAAADIIISKGVALLSNATAEACDGSFKLDGAYYSNKKDPLFSIDYTVSHFDFQDFYNSAGMFQRIAPIAEYIEGHFNTKLKMNGRLSDGLNPDLSSISAEGFLETIDSKIKGFKPLEAVGDAIGISALKNVAIENTRNWLEIKEGNIIIKPQDYEWSGIKVNIGGSHNINQTMNYLAKLEVPRELFKDKNPVSDQVDKGLEELSKEASQLGIDIFSGDYIYLNAEITGNIDSPTLRIVPTGSGGKSLSEEATEVITDRIDEIKEEYKGKIIDVVDKKTGEVKETAENEIEKINTKVDSVLDDKIEEAGDKVIGVIEDQIDTSISTILQDSLATGIKDKLDDILNNKDSEVDKIKDKLKDIKIFKKKKKGN